MVGNVFEDILHKTVSGFFYFTLERVMASFVEGYVNIWNTKSVNGSDRFSEVPAETKPIKVKL